MDRFKERKDSFNQESMPLMLAPWESGSICPAVDGPGSRGQKRRRAMGSCYSPGTS